MGRGAIEEIRDYEAFLNLCQELESWIREKQDQRRAEYTLVGLEAPPRIRFEEVDLHERLDELLSVQRTLHGRRFSTLLSRSKTDSRRARFVAFAGICQLVKDEYDGHFWSNYHERIGYGADNTVYDRIWARAFKEVGAELIEGYYRREFVQSFILESGIPKHRNRDILEFFVLYWRYFRDHDDIENLIHGILLGKAQMHHVPQHEKNRMIELCELGEEYPIPFARAVNKLSKVFEYIEASPEILAGSIEDYLDEIRREIGFDPMEVLHDRGSLQKLYDSVMGLVTPSKLMRILQSKPSTVDVLLPTGKKTQIGRYDQVIYGHHVIEGVRFICVPSLAYGLQDLVNLPNNEIMRHGRAVILRATSGIYAELGGRPRPDLVRPFYSRSDGGAATSCGNLLYVEIPPATELLIRTADRRVSTVIDPDDGIDWSPMLQLVTKLDGTYGLSIFVPHILLKSEANKNDEVGVYVSDGDTPVAKIRMDVQGYGKVSQRSLSIKSPTPGTVSLRILETATLAPVTLNNTEVRSNLDLRPVMLFSGFVKREICERSDHRQISYGGRTFILLKARRIPKTAVVVTNLEAGAASRLGDYDVLELAWDNKKLPAELSIKHKDHLWSWTFQRCCDIRMTLLKDPACAVPLFNLKDDQAIDLSCFSIKLTPALGSDEARNIFWTIVRTGERPTRIRFSDGPQGSEERDGALLGPEDLKRLLEMSGSAKIDEPTSFELALCAADEVMSSVRLLVLKSLEIRTQPHFEEDDRVSVGVACGDEEYDDIPLYDSRGRGQAKLALSESDGKWMLKEREYSGKLELPRLGTDIEIAVIPKVQGARLTDTVSGEASPVRTLTRKESIERAIVIVDYNKRWPSTEVNGKRVEFRFERDGEIYYAALEDLPDVTRPENLVEFSTPTQKHAFEIRFESPEVESTSIAPHISDGRIVGTISFTGPEGSVLVFRAIDEDTKAEVGTRVISCDGRYHLSRSVEIDVGEGGNAFLVSLHIYKDAGDDSTCHEYGRTWRVLRTDTPDSEDLEVISRAAQSAYSAGRYFTARRLIESLRAAHGGAPVDIGAKCPNIEYELLNACMSCLAGQVERALKKEFRILIGRNEAND